MVNKSSPLVPQSRWLSGGKLAFVSRTIADLKQFKQQALLWASVFETVCYLDSRQYDADKYSSYEALIAVGAKRSLSTYTDSFQQLKDFINIRPSWLFGFLTYDLKNEIERLQSDNFDGIGLPAMHFFEPECVIAIEKNKVTIHAEKPEEIWQAIERTDTSPPFDTSNTSLNIQPRIAKRDYLKTVEKIRQHIIEGDLYEMNFCQEFYAEDADIHPIDLFTRLNDLAKAPFSAFYKYDNRYLLCSSPERFLKKTGQKLISQPIKGTIKRGKSKSADSRMRNRLYNSTKDRAENVMIVDLVRNDLSRSSETGSIKVDELFGIYGFEQVHHMISTISSTLKDDVHPVDAIRYAFPMGSMTGAPKVMSMELIEQYEQTKRGLYSGAVGYFTPDGDFDFNVVIRSILYNVLSRYLSFQVGGAIVYDSVPEQEYEECLLKAKAMMQVLT